MHPSGIWKPSEEAQPRSSTATAMETFSLSLTPYRKVGFYGMDGGTLTMAKFVKINAPKGGEGGLYDSIPELPRLNLIFFPVTPDAHLFHIFGRSFLCVDFWE